VLRHERLVASRHDRKLVPEPLGIVEAQAIGLALDVDPLAAEPLRPEVDRVLGGDAPDDAVHHPGAGPAPLRPRILEECDVRSGRALLVGIEQVVDGRIVLVHGLLHQPQAEDAGVEVDVSGSVPRDRRHVVDSFQAHGLPPM
jgi:hypothetical protein